MAALGARLSAQTFTHVVVDGSADAPTAVEDSSLTMPKGSRAAQLAWLRKEVREVLARTGATSAAFKAPEAIAQKKDLGRAEAEGIFQEACESLDVPVLSRVKSQIRADVRFKESARYLDKALPPSLQALPKNRHEAALAAVSALIHA